MKLVNKKNLKFVNGFVVDKKGRVYNDSRILSQLKELELILEALSYVDENKAAIEAIKNGLPKFEPRKRSGRINVKIDKPETPELDKHIKQIESMFEEVQSVQIADDANEVLEVKFGNLIEFVSSEEFVWIEDRATTEPYPVNVLEINVEAIVGAVIEFVENKDLISAIEIQ